MARQWPYLINPFNKATEGSFRAMKKISDYTYYALEHKIPPPAFVGGSSTTTSIPAEEVALYTEIRNELRPLMENYNTRYNEWLVAFADRKGQTTRLVELFEQLRSEKIQEWDVVIQATYNSKSAAYQRLMPRRRKPFQTGQYQTRIDALQLLTIQIADDTNFDADFRTDISNFYTELFTEYKNQASEKSDTSYASNNLEPARKALAKGLYSALGKMIWYFAADTDKITTFFDMEVIRDSEQTIFRHAVKPTATINAVHRTLNENTSLRLQNDGASELIFWLAENIEDGPGEHFVTVAKNTEKLVSPAELGGIGGKYLNVKNPHEGLSGHYVITIN